MMFWNRRKKTVNGSSNQTPQDNTSNLQSVESNYDESTILGCFQKYFTIITGLLSNSQYNDRPIIAELFSSMLSVLLFLSDYYDIDVPAERKEIINWFLTPFNTSMKEKQFSEFASMLDDRINFYKSHSLGDNLRGEFLLDDIPSSTKNWPPYRYGVILCDCIYNPNCIIDYDNSPVLVTGISSHLEESVFFRSILGYFEEYAKAIKEFLILKNE